MQSKIVKVYLIFLFAFGICSSNGQNYFQQEVNYTINVKLDDSLNMLRAFESIEYINNSNNTLSFIYFHLWPNAYKNNKTALAKQLLENGSTDLYFAKPNDLGYIDSLDFKVNGESIKWVYDSINIDICKLILNSPLSPGSKITITTPFRVKIPNGEISRLGHVGQAYTITQWYPKPAVYDNNGWNQIPYLNQGEFFSEYGSFDVSITVPKNYVLGATGDMVNGEEELAWLQTKIEKTEAKISKLGKERVYLSMDFPKSDLEIKTLRFKQSNVHDFAWFCDKRYNVLKGEVIVPHTKRTVTTWAMFTDSEIELWQYSIAYLNDATFFYSLWNGDYPYKHVTAVDGTISAGGGMEYPNITVIGKSGNESTLETTIMHEVGHNWFYGILGSNERVNPWMDEGINSFNEMRYNLTKYPNLGMANTLLGIDTTSKILKYGNLNLYGTEQQYYLFYKMQALVNKDQACQTHSAEFTDMNYGAMVYFKTAASFNYLMNYMGEDAFDVAMQFYFNTWKFKHPKPEDLRKILEYYSEKNLSWFFDDLLFSTKKMDYKIKSFKKEEDNSYRIIVKNVGEIKGPVALCGLKNGEILGMVWYDGFEGEKELSVPPGEYDEFMLDYFKFTMDVNAKNNSIRTKGLFKKAAPVELKLLGAIDDLSKQQMYVSPLLAYNQYDKLMAGLSIYNHLAFSKKLEYELMPMYAFGSSTLTGVGNLQYNVYPKKVFQQVSIGLSAARFNYDSEPFLQLYNKLNPFVEFEIKKKRERSSRTQKIKLRSVIISKTKADYLKENNYSLSKENVNLNFYELSYSFVNDRRINPFENNLVFQTGDNMSKLFNTFKYSITYNSKKKFTLRLFAGVFLQNSSTNDYRFRMSSWVGQNDYLYDNLYFGRSANIPNVLSQQVYENDGGFKVYSFAGQSNRWLTSLNIQTPKLFKLPLSFYVEGGLYNTTGLNQMESMYNVGATVSIYKKFFVVYLPITYSQNIKNALSINNYRYVDNIRFTLNLNQLNVFSEIRKNGFQLF